MSNNDMNLPITEMMELILTGANGSELAVEGVMRTAIDHIKKLEEQNELMLAALKRITKYTKWVVAEDEFINGRKISIEERDLHGLWHDAIHESCGAIAYAEGEEE